MCVGLCLWCNSRERVIFLGILDVNFEVGWMSVDRLRTLATTDLPLEVAAVAAWDALFVGGTIYVWQGFLRKGLGKGDLECEFKISMKPLKCREKLSKISPHHEL